MTPSLEALRSDLISAGWTAESAKLDADAERMAAEDRRDY
jgi:hypothetical protein